MSHSVNIKDSGKDQEDGGGFECVEVDKGEDAMDRGAEAIEVKLEEVDGVVIEDKESSRGMAEGGDDIDTRQVAEDAFFDGSDSRERTVEGVGNGFKLVMLGGLWIGMQVQKEDGEMGEEVKFGINKVFGEGGGGLAKGESL